MNEQIRQLKIGNIYGEYCGTGFAGNVYDSNGVSPCLTTFDGGNRQPLIIEEEKSPPELIEYIYVDSDKR